MRIKSQNIIYHNNKAYQILEVLNSSNFKNSDGSLNPKVIGLYVSQIKANHVLQQNNKLLMCQEIEDAQIEEN